LKKSEREDKEKKLVESEERKNSKTREE